MKPESPYSAYLEKNFAIQREAVGQLEQLGNRFRSILSETMAQEVSFRASKIGYATSFEFIDNLMMTAQSVGQTLTFESAPVFLKRRQPPIKKCGHVVFSIHDFFTGKTILEKLRELSGLESCPRLSDSSIAALEIARQREIEKLRLLLESLQGKECERAETSQPIGAKILANNVNQKRRFAKVSFLFRGKKTENKLQKVSLQSSNKSFRLLRSTDNKVLFSSLKFPRLFLDES